MTFLGRLLKKRQDVWEKISQGLYYMPAFPFGILLGVTNPLRKHNAGKTAIDCPACGSKESSFKKWAPVKEEHLLMYDDRKSSAYLYRAKGYLGDGVRYFCKPYYDLEWRLCSSCGNAFQNFPHTNETLFNYYSKFSDERPVKDVPESTKKVKTLAAKYFIEKSGLKPPARIIDIGAAIGLAVKYLQDNGYDAWGIEPSSQRVDIARNLLGLKNFKHGFYEQGVFEKDFFDGIISHHVIEHVLEPEGFFKALAENLKPGGWLLLQLPAIEEDRTATTHNDHLIGYSLKGMTYLLEGYGFEIVKAEVVPKDPDRIPEEWKIKDADCKGWTIHGVRPGAMSVLARRK